MAFSTTNILVTEQDGWTLVSESPDYLIIQGTVHRPWSVAIQPSAGGAPSVETKGLQFGQNRGDKALEYFKLDGAVVGDIYVRIKNNPDSGALGDQQGMAFVVIEDDGV